MDASWRRPNLRYASWQRNHGRGLGGSSRAPGFVSPIPHATNRSRGKASRTVPRARVGALKSWRTTSKSRLGGSKTPGRGSKTPGRGWKRDGKGERTRGSGPGAASKGDPWLDVVATWYLRDPRRPALMAARAQSMAERACHRPGRGRLPSTKPDDDESLIRPDHHDVILRRRRPTLHRRPARACARPQSMPTGLIGRLGSGGGATIKRMGVRRRVAEVAERWRAATRPVHARICRVLATTGARFVPIGWRAATCQRCGSLVFPSDRGHPGWRANCVVTRP